MFLTSVEADVEETTHRLIIRMTSETRIARTDMRMPNINLDINMSEQEWVSEDEEEGEDEEDKE